MSSVNNLVEQARAEIFELGYPSRGLSTYEFPQTIVLDTTAGPVRYAEYGSTDAQTTVFASMPFGNNVDAPNMQLRLQAQQDTLGQDFNVVGVQEVIHGSKAENGFQTYGRRLIGLLEYLQPKNRAGFYGFSMGADISAEAAYGAVFDENGSNVPIDFVGAWDPSRSQERKWTKLLKDFGDSGKDLFDNVVAGNSGALNESYKIDVYSGDMLAEKSKFDGRIARQVAISSARHLFANKRLAQDMANERTKEQLQQIVDRISPEVMKVIVGRAVDSLVTPQSFLDGFGSRSIALVVDGDHSVADDLAVSAALLGKTVGF